MELEMHFEITNSRPFHQVCRCCTDLMCVSQSSWVLTVLESSIVIVEGVTLVLIDKEEKNLPEAMLSSLWAGPHSVITACRLSLWAFAAWICVSLHSLHWNVLLVSAVLNWPHLSGRFGITAIEGGEKDGCVCVCLCMSGKKGGSHFKFHQVFSELIYFSQTTKEHTHHQIRLPHFQEPNIIGLLTYGALVHQRWDIGALVRGPHAPGRVSVASQILDNQRGTPGLAGGRGPGPSPGVAYLSPLILSVSQDHRVRVREAEECEL